MSRARHMMGKEKKDPKPKPYNAQGSAVEREAESEKDGFNKGGRTKHKKMHGEKAKHHLAKRARGGKAGGGRTMSMAAKTAGEGKMDAHTNAADD